MQKFCDYQRQAELLSAVTSRIAMIGPKQMALTCVEERDDESRFENTSYKMISTAGKGSAIKFSPTSEAKQIEPIASLKVFGDSNEKLIRSLENTTATLLKRPDGGSNGKQLMDDKVSNDDDTSSVEEQIGQ